MAQKRRPSAYELTHRLGIKDWEAEVIRAYMTGPNPIRTLEVADAFMDGYGVEDLKSMYYVNMGQTYKNTLLYSRVEGRYYVCSWGTWVETHPSRFKD